MTARPPAPPPPQQRCKKYRCVMCAVSTSTKTEMKAHIDQVHSVLKITEKKAVDAGAEAKKKAPSALKLTIVKANLKTKPPPPPPVSNPALQKKLTTLFEYTTASDFLMRSWVRSVPCAELAPLWQCLACRKQFDDKLLLNEHMKSKHVLGEMNKKGPLKERILGYCCAVCGRCFDELEYMICHQQVAHPQQDPPTFEYLKYSVHWGLLCFICLLYYRRDDKWFTNHQCQNWVDVEMMEGTKRAAETDPSFICDVCGLTFRHKCAFQYHRVLRHKGVTDIDWEAVQPISIPFVCDKCEKGFTQISGLQMHACDTSAEEIMQLQPEKPKVKCHLCGAQLSSRKGLRRHIMGVHEKVLPSRAERRMSGRTSFRPPNPTIKCPFCELKFKTSKDTLRHAQDVHNQTLRSPYYCATCARLFDTNTKLARHNEIHHSGPEDEETVRSICQPVEKTKDGEVFYVCPICGRKFIERMAYFRHHQWHQIERKFTCDRCGHLTTTKEALVLHIKKVHEKVQCSYECAHCHKVLSTKFSLREHLATHSADKSFICEKCGKNFGTKVRLQSHVRAHIFGSQFYVSKRRYKCNLCTKEFKKKQTLRDHLAVHSGVKNEQCPDCGKKFFTKLSVYCHKVQAHATHRPFKCTVCEADFALRSFLNRHMKRHRNKEAAAAAAFATSSLWMGEPAEKSASDKEEADGDVEVVAVPPTPIFLHDYSKYVKFYKIEEYNSLIEEFICSDTAANTDDGNDDDEDLDPEAIDDNTSDPAPFIKSGKCADDGVVSFVSPDEFTQHECEPDHLSSSSIFHKSLRREMSSSLLVQHVCLLCNEQFGQRGQLVLHLQQVHQLNVQTDSSTQPVRLSSGKFQCPVCDKEFCRKLNASQHLITHISQKNIQCDCCSFKCYTKSQLEVHKKKHVKRFGCELCAKMFAYRFQLETHVQGVHYNIRPFPCNICGKTFKTRYNYGSHMAQHRDIRNFQCPYCPRKCRKSYDLRVHVRTHTGEKPFQCSYCQRCYSQNGDRLKHERHCHSKMKTSFVAKGVAAPVLAETYSDNDEIPESSTEVAVLRIH